MKKLFIFFIFSIALFTQGCGSQIGDIAASSAIDATTTTAVSAIDS